MTLVKSETYLCQASRGCSDSFVTATQFMLLEYTKSALTHTYININLKFRLVQVVLYTFFFVTITRNSDRKRERQRLRERQRGQSIFYYRIGDACTRDHEDNF